MNYGTDRESGKQDHNREEPAGDFRLRCSGIVWVQTKRIKETVKNNPDKFPEGYIILNFCKC